MTILLEALAVVVITSSFLGIGKRSFNLMKVENTPWVLDGLLGAGLYAFLVSVAGHFISLFELSWVLIISDFVIFNFGIYKNWFQFTFQLSWQVHLYLLFALLIAFFRALTLTL